ncbi:hypothetical protein J3R83DRAFT_13940 [Lanmaoa asiatica]|nr:hypothetical protein J3R83DRAFT_13940 [Lanmaoa asiatica]
MDPSPLPDTQSQHHPHPGPAPSTGPQIRSRVTVVCAECKRLKLKCDRRTPCGSCTKRDTVARCVYSPAAAEKVDLHSLNNRLIQVESQLAQFTAPGARSHNFYNQPASPSTQSDRPLLAVGQSGSSLAISLDDITAVWLDELDLSKDILPIQSAPSYPPCTVYASNHVKVEQAPTVLPSHDAPSPSDPPVHLLLPPLTAYYVSALPTATEPPSVNPRLLVHLPFAPRRRQKLFDIVEDVLKMHPCFNFKHFKDRAEAMFKWSSEVDGHDNSLADPPMTQNGASGTLPTTSKVDTARAIFFGLPTTPTSSRTPPTPKPTLSLYAAVAAAFALGTLVDREITEEEARLDAAHGDGVTPDDSSSRPHTRRKPDLLPVLNKKCKGVAKDAVCSPAVLFALSQQALSLFEKSNPYDLDSLVTMILHVLYALHDSRTRVVHTLLPEASDFDPRTMGLDMDPDEFPGKFNLFEAESRRRLWWDIFYYDLFVSDYMGRSPLISDAEYTTRLPMDVDEDVFTPACTTIPLPRSPLSLLEPNSSDFKYFGLKCRLAQLVKDIKRRSLRDSVQNDPAVHEQFTLEQAASCANEIKQWLADLPCTFRMDVDSDSGVVHAPQSDGGTPPSANPGDSTNVSPVLLAQRCELAVTAQRLVMKVYIPFLRPSYGHGNSTSYYQATVGTFTAAHAIIRSLKTLCSMWKQRPDLRGRRPMPALFSFYSFSRALFDAAVACAHNVIKDPNSVWVNTAFEDVGCALEILRDPMLNTGRGPMRGGVEGGVQEAIKIVELLQRKAESARHGSSDAASAGTKRKHDEIEADVEQLRRGFRFPFVSAPVMAANVPMHTADPASPPSATSTHPVAATSGPPPNQQAQTARRCSPAEEQSKRPPSAVSSVAPKHGSDRSKSKDKHSKKLPYPQTGIRVRTGKEPSPFTKLCISPAVPAPSNADSDPPPPVRQVSSIAPSPVVEHPPYSQQLASFPPASQNMSIHHASVPQKLDGGPVDFLVPFGAGDDAGRAQTQINIDISQTRRYCQTEMSQDVSSIQPAAKVSPAVATFERPHSGPFPGSSPASYAPSNGSYSSLNSPYTNGGTQFSTTPSHEQQSPSFDIPTPTQNYYPYDPQTQSHSIALVGVNHGGDDMPFQIRDQAVSQNESLFQYQHDKPHQGMYAPERQSSVPQSPFTEQHTQSMAQAWTPQAGSISEENGFWRSYDPFTA